MIQRIVLADDHRIMREGLRRLLDAEPGLEVVGEAGDGRTAITLVEEHHPDLVILDIGMPDLNGIEAARRILGEHPTIKIVALSMHADRRFVGEMLKAGASAYVLKEGAFEELIAAIEAVTEGKIYLSPRIAGVVVDDYLTQMERPARTVFGVLSSREREVLQLMAEGLATKEIAAALHVSVKTIETHRRQIMEKLNLHSVAELTKYAIREGLTSVER